MIQHAIVAANNYASSLKHLNHFEEAKALFRRTIPVARRVLGDDHRLTLRMRSNYAAALCKDSGTKLGELREAVTTLKDAERIARRVLGGAHPVARSLEYAQNRLRAALATRDSPPSN